MAKKILHFDMDNVLVDFQSAFPLLDDSTLEKYEGNLDEVPGIFALMTPLPGAVEAFKLLSQHYDVYIASTAPWENPSAWRDKIRWVQAYLGPEAHKRLTLTHNKNLLIGDYLIDDRLANGAVDFQGEHIHFGVDPKFMDWESVLRYLMPDAITKQVSIHDLKL